MPSDSNESLPHPYHRSLPWSRRFIGLRLFMTLAQLGCEGYAEVLRHQIEMGQYLRECLRAKDWKIVNETPWPVVCFVDDKSHLEADKVVALVALSGKSWITPTVVTSTGAKVLRAGIANATTQPEHIDLLVEALDSAREQIRRHSGHRR